MAPRPARPAVGCEHRLSQSPPRIAACAAAGARRCATRKPRGRPRSSPAARAGSDSRSPRRSRSAATSSRSPTSTRREAEAAAAALAARGLDVSAVALDVTRRRAGAAGRGRGRRPDAVDDHRVQRRPRLRGHDRRHDARGVRPRHGGQRPRCLLRHAGRAARDVPARPRKHRQHQLDLRLPVVERADGGLRPLEGGRQHAHGLRRARERRGRHPRERGRARHGRHRPRQAAAERAGDRAAEPRAHPARPAWPRRRRSPRPSRSSPPTQPPTSPATRSSSTADG